MLSNILRRSFLNQKKAVALMVASVAVGTAVAASFLTMSLEISGKVARELRSFGANILIEPRVEGLADISDQKRYLRQDDIVKAKTIFWRHNILGLVPFLKMRAPVSAGARTETYDVIGTWYEKRIALPGREKSFTAGTTTVFPWWNLDGEWPGSNDRAVVGISLAQKYRIRKGDVIHIDGKGHAVSGILQTGGKEDSQVFLDLPALQALGNMEGKVSTVLVSALSKPMDEFAYRDPETMNQKEYEKWYCTGYVTSIARQLEEVFQGSRVKPIWNVAETEGRILGRLKLLIYLLSLIAIAASALGVSTTMIMSFLRRLHEIGLMKAMGADTGKIVTVFFTEAIAIGIAGGLIGYGLSTLATQFIGTQVFNTAFEQRNTLFPLAIGSAIVIAVAGAIIPMRRALSVKPGMVLKGAER